MAGRPAGAQNKDKPFREALRMELVAAGDDHKTLRKIAKNLIAIASTANDPAALPAIREIADRMDGKPVQAIAGDEDNPLRVAITRVELVPLAGNDDSPR